MKLALRQLLKNPGFTALAMLTLALGIGGGLSQRADFSIPNFPVPEFIAPKTGTPQGSRFRPA
jgi:hypothetical protein